MGYSQVSPKVDLDPICPDNGLHLQALAKVTTGRVHAEVHPQGSLRNGEESGDGIFLFASLFLLSWPPLGDCLENSREYAPRM